MMEFTQGMGAGGKMGEAHKPSSPVVLLLLKDLLIAKLLRRTCSLACLHYSNLQRSPQADQSWDSASILGLVLPAQAAPALQELGRLSSETGTVSGAEHQSRTLHVGCLSGVFLFGPEFLCPGITLRSPPCLCPSS